MTKRSRLVLRNSQPYTANLILKQESSEATLILGNLNRKIRPLAVSSNLYSLSRL